MLTEKKLADHFGKMHLLVNPSKNHFDVTLLPVVFVLFDKTILYTIRVRDLRSFNTQKLEEIFYAGLQYLKAKSKCACP